jgi:hypothetical protein
MISLLYNDYRVFPVSKTAELLTTWGWFHLWSETCRGKFWTFNLFLINTELWVHELVSIETGHIDARFKHEVLQNMNLVGICDFLARHLGFFISQYLTNELCSLVFTNFICFHVVEQCFDHFILRLYKLFAVRSDLESNIDVYNNARYPSYWGSYRLA